MTKLTEWFKEKLEKIRLMETKLLLDDCTCPKLAVWLEETYDEKLTSPVEVILDHWEIWVVSHVHDNEDQHGRSFYKRLSEFVFDIYKFKIKQFKGKIMGLFSKIKNFFRRPKKEVKSNNKPRDCCSSRGCCSSPSRPTDTTHENNVAIMFMNDQESPSHTRPSSHSHEYHGYHYGGSSSHGGNHSCSDHNTTSVD